MSVNYTSGFTNATVTPGKGATVAGGKVEADGGYIPGAVAAPDANTVYEGNKGQTLQPDANTLYTGNKGQSVTPDAGSPNLPGNIPNVVVPGSE